MQTELTLVKAFRLNGLTLSDAARKVYPSLELEKLAELSDGAAESLARFAFFFLAYRRSATRPLMSKHKGALPKQLSTKRRRACPTTKDLV